MGAWAGQTAGRKLPGCFCEKCPWRSKWQKPGNTTSTGSGVNYVEVKVDVPETALSSDC
jgi:hypothetical protein